MATEEIRPDDLLPPNAFAARYPNLTTPGGLRWQIFCANQNGLEAAGAIVRRGRRVFVVVPRYMDWMVHGGRLGGCRKAKAA
jgi:hypothetical protein